MNNGVVQFTAVHRRIHTTRGTPERALLRSQTRRDTVHLNVDEGDLELTAQRVLNPLRRLLRVVILQTEGHPALGERRPWKAILFRLRRSDGVLREFRKAISRAFGTRRELPHEVLLLHHNAGRYGVASGRHLRRA